MLTFLLHPQKRKPKKEMGEYIDYEEIDWSGF